MVKKNIGIEAKQPENTCEDSKCPWHGQLSLRGRVFTGTVVSNGGKNTVIVRWHYNYFISKYERYERRNTSVSAYNPDCINAKKGDIVKIAECRPISKTKSFAVIEKVGVKQ
ncbi:MAG: 30S ribosomal protein S17 [Candidatus Aenigmarchaeota archaeon]|nr:30S ribosomal protein S17 [Candidatus Aenigmarchaeota archaeon]